MLNENTLLRSYEYIKKYQCLDCLIYNSIDVRESKFKASPVDNNIFPAGFNNISKKSVEIFSQKLTEYFLQNNIKTVVLVCEDHTRNIGYLHNVKILFDAITKAGVKAEITTLTLESHTVELNDETFSFAELELFECKTVGTKNIPKPDLIILNNDLSGQQAQECSKLKAMQNMKNVMPSAKMGWNNRKKSSHFIVYEELAKEVAQNVGFDHWFINAEFTTAQCMDFTSTQELTNLADAASDLFKKIKAKYKEYKISQTPAVFLKSESGTYGLGVEKITHPEDLLNPNRTFRKKILYNKSKIANTEFLLQEAVPTAITQNGGTAECTIYTTFGESFGGFYRIHKQKNTMDNLNSKGAEFCPLEVEIAQRPSLLNFCAKLSSIAVSKEKF